MAVVYRSVWEDDRIDLAAVAYEEFASWVASKRIALDVPDAGEVRSNGVAISCVRAEADGPKALRLRLEEDGNNQFWSTTVMVIEDAGRRWGWVDLNFDTTEVYARPPDFSSPRIARALVRDGHARVGALTLRDEPEIVSSDGVPALRDLIFDPDRQLPVSVFTMAHGESFDVALERARRAADDLAGVALVHFVTGPAVPRLNEALGFPLHVFGGAVRTYLPGVDPDNPRGFRHRYIKREQVGRHPAAAARILARVLFRQAAGIRPPEVFRRALRDAFAGADNADLETLLELQDSEIDDLSRRLRDAEDSVEIATLEQEEAQGRADELAARVRYLEDELEKAGAHLRGVPTPEEDLPATAETLSEVAALVDSRLDHLSFSPGATADVETLDEQIRAGVWAKKAWQSFRALDEYARRKVAGEVSADFKQANRNGELGTYGVPDSWVTMHESNTTDQHPGYREARTFTVPPSVDPAGRVYMDAHIKLQPGGRPCPRIHFHDDTAGTTGRIHVGWFGDHLENQKTN